MESVRNICAKIISQFRSRFPELYTKLPAFTELTRANKPIGIYLLLWPTISALWIAEEGLPRFSLLFIFVVGTALMRSAGCCINDFAYHLSNTSTPFFSLRSFRKAHEGQGKEEAKEEADEGAHHGQG